MTARAIDQRAESLYAVNSAFHLENVGYCLLKGLLSTEIISQISKDLALDFEETPLCSGPFYGARTRRFGRLLARSDLVAELVMNPFVLGLAERILGPWCDAIQLNVAQAIEIEPNALEQYPHRDQDMYWGDKGRIEYLVNVIWPLTPFRSGNGATRLWPDSHGHAAAMTEPEHSPLAAECDPGDAIVFLGSTLHAAGANMTTAGRRGIVIGYSLGWLKPYENPWLAYPPEIARFFSPALQALVGYRQHRPNLGNFEGQCPSVLLQDDRQGRRAATDALHPDQAALLADYVARQQIGRDA